MNSLCQTIIKRPLCLDSSIIVGITGIVLVRVVLGCKVCSLLEDTYSMEYIYIGWHVHARALVPRHTEIPALAVFSFVVTTPCPHHSVAPRPLLTHPSTRTVSRFVSMNRCSAVFGDDLVRASAGLSLPLIHRTSCNSRRS
jgi:hypothetical protein